MPTMHSRNSQNRVVLSKRHDNSVFLHSNNNAKVVLASSYLKILNTLHILSYLNREFLDFVRNNTAIYYPTSPHWTSDEQVATHYYYQSKRLETQNVSLRTILTGVWN